MLLSFPIIRRATGLAAAALVCYALAGPRPSAAQSTARLQAGLGIFPGIGLQVGYIDPRALYTMEGTFYAEGTPGYAGGEGTLLVSGGIGGAIRVFGILRMIGNAGYAARDLDVGLRIGPSLFFSFGESSRDENPFGLFLDPFARFTSTFGTQRTFFVEAGIQRPIVRAGLVFELD